MNGVAHREPPRPGSSFLQTFASEILITDCNMFIICHRANDLTILLKLHNGSPFGIFDGVWRTEHNEAVLRAAAINQLFEVESKLIRGDSDHVVQAKADGHDFRTMLKYVCFQSGQTI